MLFDANVRTVVTTTQAAARAMAARGGGSIVTITGEVGVAPHPRGQYAGYGSAKAAVLHWTRDLAAELGPAGVRANTVSPGITMTARVAARAEERGLGTSADLETIPLRRFAEPDDIARTVQFLASDMASYISGQCISVCGGKVRTPV